MTTRRLLIALGIIAVVAVAVVAYAFLRPPEEATGPIQAPTVELSPPTTLPEETAINVAEPTATVLAEATLEPTEEPVPEPTATTGTGAQDSPLRTPEPTATMAPAPAATDVVQLEPTAETEAIGPVIFEIDQSESQARFIIEEVLRGSDTTVVGITDQVAAQIAIDTATPANSQIGEVVVNARTLVTDNDFRNRAIKNQILRTNDYEFVTFTPTAITGLPDSVSVGDTFSFQVTGDLAITDITREVTFDVTISAVSPTRIEGLASTTILYADFGLFIPDSPSVDTVEDSVRLELEFVATAST